MIRKASRSIDMAYYIYSNDESSSLISQELIAAAQRGVKVRVLTDYITTYSNLDVFTAMMSAGKGNLEFRLYGRPTPNVIKDMVYASTACSDANNVKGNELACAAEKQVLVNKMNSVQGKDAYNYNTGNSGVLLSGIYAKSGPTINFASLNAKINTADYTNPNGEAMPQEEKDGLMELLKRPPLTPV